jgi:hypothetical protein
MVSNLCRLNQATLQAVRAQWMLPQLEALLHPPTA